jgi:hypothetical protein
VDLFVGSQDSQAKEPSYGQFYHVDHFWTELPALDDLWRDCGFEIFVVISWEVYVV